MNDQTDLRQRISDAVWGAATSGRFEDRDVIADAVMAALRPGDRDAQLWADAAAGADRLRQLAENDRDQDRLTHAAVVQELTTAWQSARRLAFDSEAKEARQRRAHQRTEAERNQLPAERDRLAAELSTSRRGAAEREDQLEAVRDTLEAAGHGGAHGHDWPEIGPALAALVAERDRLQARLNATEWDAQARLIEAQRRQLNDTIAAVQRVRDLHKPVDAGSDPSCEVCSNHGDITWPCATITALDDPAAQSSCPVDRAAVYRVVAARLAADAEQGAKNGLTRIYRRAAAEQVRAWADTIAPDGPTAAEPSSYVLVPGCPHCPDGHTPPDHGQPWGAYLTPARDGDGQPTTIHVARAGGAHVAESDAQWVRDRLNRPSTPAERPDDDTQQQDGQPCPDTVTQTRHTAHHWDLTGPNTWNPTDGGRRCPGYNGPPFGTEPTR